MTTVDKAGELIVPMPKVIIVDVFGVVLKPDFDRHVRDYCEASASMYLEKNWSQAGVQDIIKAMCKQSLKDGPKIVLTGDNKGDIRALVKYVNSSIHYSRTNETFTKFKNAVYLEGVMNERVKPKVYSDVATCFEIWSKKIAIYAISYSSIDLCKMYLSHSTNTTTGPKDLAQFLSGFFDQSYGSMMTKACFDKVVGKLQVEPHEICFITNNAFYAEAAMSANLTSLLVLSQRSELNNRKHHESIHFVRGFQQIHFEQNLAGSGENVSTAAKTGKHTKSPHASPKAEKKSPDNKKGGKKMSK